MSLKLHIDLCKCFCMSIFNEYAQSFMSQVSFFFYKNYNHSFVNILFYIKCANLIKQKFSTRIFIKNSRLYCFSYVHRSRLNENSERPWLQKAVFLRSDRFWQMSHIMTIVHFRLYSSIWEIPWSINIILPKV